nr:MAG TPA: putative peptidoglycan binding domain protein [Caudoviricetes sp.]
MSGMSIYGALVRAGMTAAGACGLMGNMQAESGMKSNIVQRGMTALSDGEYTRRADAGEPDFIRDGAGYGLCQWTYRSRKQALLRFARERGVSVGDEGMQVEFCLSELCGEYPALRRFLCETQDVRAAAERVCREYERPAVNNVDARAAYAARFADMAAREGWGNNPLPEGTRPQAAVAVSKADSPLYKGVEGAEKAESADGAKGAEEAGSAEAYWPPRMICEGMSGSDVAAAQALLRARGIECPAAGVFDAQTRAAVLTFQARRGLDRDGIAGGMTWGALLDGARP